MGRLLGFALLVVGLGALWVVLSLVFPPRETAPRSPAQTAEPAVRVEQHGAELARDPASLVLEREALRPGRGKTVAAPSVRVTNSQPPARAPIEGRVVRPDGTPVPGAEVVLECAPPYRSKLGPLARAETDAQGRFGLDCHRVGPFRVLATERVAEVVVAEVAREEVYPNRGALELVLHSALAFGRVVDDLGRPVTDFRITWTPLPEGGGRAGAGERFRSSGGEFSSQLWPGAWRASVDPEADLLPAQLELSVPVLEPMRIVLARPAVVRESVVDVEGEPVHGARILHGGAGWGESAGDGTFELKVQPDQIVKLRAHRERCAPSETIEFSLAAGEERNDIVLRLGPAARLTGEVIDPHGRPVSGREVRINAQMQPGVSYGSEAPQSLQTDANGRFEAEVLPGPLYASVKLDDYELQARSWTDVRTCVRRVTLAPGESTHIRLDMRGRPVRLHGRIEVDGSAPTWAHVTVRNPLGGPWHEATFADGVYEALVPEPGAYSLSVSLEELNVQPDVDVPAGEEWRFDVLIPLHRVTGHVRDEAGNPLEGIVVDAMIHGGGQALRASGRAETDRDGAFSLQLLPGTYRVHPRADFEEQRSFREPEAQLVNVETERERTGVDFVLQSTGALDGVVRRQDSGALDEILVVALSTSDDSEGRDPYAHDGAFHIPLDGGTYRVTALGSEGGTYFTTADPLHVELAPGAVRRLELRLVDCTLVSVRLVGPGGNPVSPPADLEAIDAYGRSLPATKHAGDVAALLLIAPGPYTLRASHAGRLFERELSLPVGETEREVEFILE